MTNSEAKPALKAQFRDAWSHLPRTLRLVFSVNRWLAVTLATLTIVGALLPVGMAYLGKRILDAVELRDTDLTVRFVAAELCLVAVTAFVDRALGLTRALLGAQMGAVINYVILEKAQTLSLGQFEDPAVYDRLSKARREASSRPLSVVTGLLSVVRSVLALLTTFGVLLHLSVPAVLALVLSAIPATLAELRYSTQAFRLRSFRAPETRRLAYIETLLGNEANAKEVLSFGLGPTFLARYRALATQMTTEDSALAKRRAAIAFVLSLLALVAFYGFYAGLAIQAARGLIGLGTLTFYVLLFRQGQSAFQSLLGSMTGIFEDNLYMLNLFGFLDLVADRPSITREPSPLPDASKAHFGSPSDPSKDGLVFENVGFQYPGKERFALRHVNLHVPRGEHIALVGENGSGKTTFIKLLTRLYEPTEGRILLDGVPLAEMDASLLRRRMGVIFQDFVRYQLSAKENISLGDVAHLDSSRRVSLAVSKAGAESIVAGLPEGLESTLGRWFNLKGAELSGGQWQRIALARAFMRDDAEILVLDEPTSALDAKSEAAIFERFQELSEGKTTFLISHRFATVRTADRILVLHDGEVIEEGSHRALLEKKGRYRELFELQAKGYL
jgi:ATP-binding cassette, subfamily B, bacterial